MDIMKPSTHRRGITEGSWGKKVFLEAFGLAVVGGRKTQTTTDIAREELQRGEAQLVGNVGERQGGIVQPAHNLERGVVGYPLHRRKPRHRAADLREVLGGDAEPVGIESHAALRQHVAFGEGEEAEEELRGAFGGLHLRQAVAVDKPQVVEEHLHHAPQHLAAERIVRLHLPLAEQGEVTLDKPQRVGIEVEHGVAPDEDVSTRGPHHLGVEMREELRADNEEISLEVGGILHLLDGVRHLPDNKVILRGAERVLPVREHHRPTPHQYVHMVCLGELRRYVTVRHAV